MSCLSRYLGTVLKVWYVLFFIIFRNCSKGVVCLVYQYIQELLWDGKISDTHGKDLYWSPSRRSLVGDQKSFPWVSEIFPSCPLTGVRSFMSHFLTCISNLTPIVIFKPNISTKETTSIVPLYIFHNFLLLYPWLTFILHNSYVTLKLAVCIQTFSNVTRLFSQGYILGRYKHPVENYFVTCVQMQRDGIGNYIVVEG